MKSSYKYKVIEESQIIKETSANHANTIEKCRFKSYNTPIIFFHFQEFYCEKKKEQNREEHLVN